jgi:PDGLE domain
VRRATRVFVIVALAVAVGLGTAVSPYASSSPDGLEKVAANASFADQGKLHSIQEAAPIADYAVPGIDNPRVATGVAGFIGVLFVFGFGYGLAYLLRRRGPRGADASIA